MLVVLTPAQNQNLTTLLHVKQQLQISEPDAQDDEFIEGLIGAASAAIVDFCRRPFAREQYRETITGSWRQNLMLSRTPILSPPLPIIFRGEPGDSTDPVIDFAVEDADAGFLYRRQGWYGSNWPPGGQYGVRPMLSFGLGQIDTSIRFTTTYWAGFEMPGGARSGEIAGITQANPGSIRSPAHGLTSGQQVLLSDIVGMDDLNGQVVTVTVVDADNFTIGIDSRGYDAYVSGGDWSLEPTGVQTVALPASIEKAAIDTVKAWRAARRRDPRITSKRIGNLAYQFDVGKETYGQFPPSVVDQLLPWRRVSS